MSVVVDGAAAMPQHMTALQKANRVRLARAELKREVASGARTVQDVILECSWVVESMPLAELLGAQHRWGRTRVRRLLNAVALGELKQVGALTVRQRDLVLAKLDGHEVDHPFSWPSAA